MKRKIQFFFMVGLIATFPVFAHVKIENPWIRASSGPNAALFMKIINTSNKPIKLIGAHIDSCARTELHTHIEENGLFRMREVKHIEISPSSYTELKPGGHHVMLIKIHGPLKENSDVPVALSFEGNDPIELAAPVKKMGESCCHKK